MNISIGVDSGLDVDSEPLLSTEDLQVNKFDKQSLLKLTFAHILPLMKQVGDLD